MGSLSERLIEARKKAGYTLVQASDLSGVPHGEMRDIEADRVEPDARDLRRLSVLYGCSLEFLMGAGGSG